MEYMNYKNFSNTARSVLETKIGYRNPYLYGSNIVDTLEIIRYEIEELGNLDIPYFCIENFGLGITEEEIDYIGSGKADDYEWNVFVEYFINRLESFLYKKTRVSPSEWYSVWVGDVEDIVKNYEGDSTNIAEVSFGDSEIIILSDLGSDGVLVLSLEPPKITYDTVLIFKVE